jgi:ATP-dependent Clp protease ATP-binding subunit ClpC
VFTRPAEPGPGVGSAELKALVREQMERAFRPEFVDRLDDIVVFRPLTRDDLRRIADRELAVIGKRLAAIGLKLVVTDEARDFLVEKGFDLDAGARALLRVIETELGDLLATESARGSLAGSDTVTVKVDRSGGSTRLVLEPSRAGPG